MAAVQVAIIDSGGANIASLRFALDRLRAESVLTTDPQLIRNASHVILPGVGAAADAMSKLRDRRLDTVVPQLTQPVLGICLGMQLLAEASQEDDATCLGIVPVIASRLTGSSRNPVPNMGWCPIRVTRSHPLLDGITTGSYFYFIHSYALPPGDFSLATADHESEMTAVLARENFYATQFHPERSSTAGARLLQNFLSI